MTPETYWDQKTHQYRLSLPDGWNATHPDNQHYTVHGRLNWYDRWLVQEMLPLAMLEKRNKPLEILDVATGYLFDADKQVGYSPTAQDLSVLLQGLGIAHHITGVDRQYQQSYADVTNQDIVYHPSIQTIGEGQFDLLRIFNLVMHCNDVVYRDIRAQAQEKLAEGGIVMATTEITIPVGINRYAGYQRRRPVKVMQKQQGELVPIALLPSHTVRNMSGNSRYIEHPEVLIDEFAELSDYFQQFGVPVWLLHTERSDDHVCARISWKQFTASMAHNRAEVLAHFV